MILDKRMLCVVVAALIIWGIIMFAFIHDKYSDLPSQQVQQTEARNEMQTALDKFVDSYYKNIEAAYYQGLKDANCQEASK